MKMDISPRKQIAMGKSPFGEDPTFGCADPVRKGSKRTVLRTSRGTGHPYEDTKYEKGERDGEDD